MRYDSDTLGRVEIPDGALYGAQTQRAVNNFTISPHPMPERFIAGLAMLKAAAAHANANCGAISPEMAQAIAAAAMDVAAGKHWQQFPVPVLQTGSGTSSNMNMNEVLATLASRHLGKVVHPNDHVNCSQSSNDVIPSCIQVSALLQMQADLMPALTRLVDTIERRSRELSSVVKTGRTHLMDAMPMTLGQEFGAWGAQLAECRQKLCENLYRLRQLPIGGSAVGTGVNVPVGFADHAIASLGEITGETFELAASPFARMAGQDVTLECSSNLRALATVLSKIANDLRWLSSGPVSGLAEIELEALQPGSSIMPGKINPVLPEAVLMACADIVGRDSSIAMAAQSGNFQLNVMLPLIADKLLGSMMLACGACDALSRCISSLKVNRELIEKRLAANPILATALNRHIGYERAAHIAKRCYAEKRSVLEVAIEETGLDPKLLAELLDPIRLANPQR